MAANAPPHSSDVETEHERLTAAAAAVLQHRLRGDLHRVAVLRVAESHRLTHGEVARAWARKKRDALSELTIGRVVDACPWTDAEVARLTRIFAGRLEAASGTAGDDTASS